jgi:hypothetical protein
MARMSPKSSGKKSLLPVVAIDYVRCGVRQIAATFDAALADSIESKLPHIDAPALAVRGARDPITPVRWVEGLGRPFYRKEGCIPFPVPPMPQTIATRESSRTSPGHSSRRQGLDREPHRALGLTVGAGKIVSGRARRGRGPA